MKIAVAGAGYVGLVTAVTLADIGHDVVCLDIDRGKLKMLREGVSPIYERGLEELMLKNRERMEFTDDVKKYSGAQVIIIGVGTPEKEDGSADLSRVRRCGQHCRQLQRRSGRCCQVHRADRNL